MEEKAKFYTYYQNNSGGAFHNSEQNGIGEYVIIEANNHNQANDIAEKIGIYSMVVMMI